MSDWTKDLCDALATVTVYTGGAMLGAITRQIAWWHWSRQGHTARLADVHVCDERLSLRGQDTRLMRHSCTTRVNPTSSEGHGWTA